jgi:pimeloyl-ACP methyl ester carboxylesterase
MPHSLPGLLLRNTALLAAAGVAIYAAAGTFSGLSRREHSTPPANSPRGGRLAQSCPGMRARSFVNTAGLRIHFSVRAPAGVDPDGGGGAAVAAGEAAEGRAVAEAIGLVVVVHGFAEHGGRYEHVAAALTRAGFVVYLMDHQGHGQSEGDRAHVVQFADYAEDVLTLARLAQDRFPQLRQRTFLLGHSMGGAIAIQAMQRAADRGAMMRTGTMGKRWALRVLAG